METLLEKAKKSEARSGTRLSISDELVELAIAWGRGEITTKQATIALNDKNKESYNSLYKIAVALREAISKGLIK